MRVAQNIFDYRESGIVGLSTANSSFGPVPAAEFGRAVLWRDGSSTDLSELCTRGAGRREMPCYARQMGDNLLLLGFVGATEPRVWRLVDIAQRRIVWEGDPGIAKNALRSVLAKLVQVSFMADKSLPLASGAGFVEIQHGMSRVVYVLEGERLVPAEWSVAQKEYADNYGLRSGLLTQVVREHNVYSLVDPRTGEVLQSFPAPTRSKGWSRPATTPGCDRIAISHAGGTVDIVDGFGAAHFSVRPFAQVARGDALPVRLSHDGQWLGADGWHLFRVVNLATREVAELPVPEPNMQDDRKRVLYDRDVLATGHGVALMDQAGLAVTPYPQLHWQPVLQPGRKAAAVSGKRYEAWRKPALALRPAASGRSWLYGSPDLPADAVPRHAGQPMRLLARIDLEEAASVLAPNPWPTRGALYFFTAVDQEGEPLQDEMFNLNATRVVWWNGPSAATGDSVPELADRQPLQLAVHQADAPDLGAAIVAAAMLADAELEAYREWLEAHDGADQPSGHRLGGYPTILQGNDLEAQAAHFADDAHYPPRDAAELAAASRWRLLLQLDSDDAFMWGTDSGMLYFLIHDDDLARQDFSRVVAVCEGH